MTRPVITAVNLSNITVQGVVNYDKGVWGMCIAIIALIVAL